MKFNLSTLLLAIMVAAGSGTLRGAETPGKISTEFFATLRGGDARQLEKAIEGGASANGRDERGNTPLMISAIYGNAACLKTLLKHGADANATNAAGATALMRAAFDSEKAELLLEAGANANVRSALGNTALMLAARPANSHRAVKALLSKGAEVNATNIGGATALMAAAAGGDRESVKLLLSRGAAVNASPAASQPGFIFGGGRSALMWAAFNGNTELAKQLLDAGADPNAEGTLGTALSQAAWADQSATARLLLDRGAKPDYASHSDGYTPLHWAASTEKADTKLVDLLLARGANPNAEGGEHVDALLVPQTPLMLARHRGDTAVIKALTKAGATNETAQRVKATPPAVNRAIIDGDYPDARREAIGRALGPLLQSAIKSKEAFLKHPSHQDCTSCHQQYLPMAATGFARLSGVAVDGAAERKLVEIMGDGDIKDPEVDGQTLFHPEPAHGRGYHLLGYDCAGMAASALTDGFVHHFAVIQEADGRWRNNLPRPPLQSGDVGATALAIHALQRYPLPGRKEEFRMRVAKAKDWLRSVKAETNEEQIFQLLGLAWAGESPKRLEPLAKALLARQREDGGWAQLGTLKSDAYATGEAIYALRVAAGLAASDENIGRGLRFLLRTQLEDGTWYVRRRAFPFQPTMDSGFPHGRDSWISASGTSWAVLALSAPTKAQAGLVEPK